MRILCWPFRSPLRLSRRLPGGTRNSLSSKTESICSSFLAAIIQRLRGNILRAFLESRPSKMCSVPASLNDRIIYHDSTATMLSQALVGRSPNHSQLHKPMTSFKNTRCRFQVRVGRPGSCGTGCHRLLRSPRKLKPHWLRSAPPATWLKSPSQL